MPEFTFHFPPVSYSDWLPIVVLTIIAGSFAIYRIMPTPDAKRDPLILQKELGLAKLPIAFFVLGAIIWSLMLFASVVGLLWTIYEALQNMKPITNEDQLALRGVLTTFAAMAATLGAVVAFPFTLIRIQHSAKQNDLTDERLFNDKLNDASQNLAAWREVTEVIGEGDERKVLTTREPDLVTRATAIDRLFGLIKERPEEASRIAAMLSLYVREHTVQVGDKIPDVPAEPTPENASANELEDWALNLTPKRSDIQKATQTIGLIQKHVGKALRKTAINLRGANLQGMDLSGLDFSFGNFEHAQMQGVNFSSSELIGASLANAALQEADLSATSLIKANLDDAKLIGAILVGAKLNEANLTEARLRGADLRGAHLKRSELFAADFRFTDLQNAELQGANLSFSDLRGADLRLAILDGVTFRRTEIDKTTDLWRTSLRGACMNKMEPSQLQKLTSYRKVAFGDGTNNCSPWPEHWPKEILAVYEFNRSWRDWVAENHPDVLKYLPEDVRNLK
ncbi:hypothetical protein BVC71_03965 [Marivivens niveibacter]|uniref:Pentapeptide repeat-containing protein n=1 Tax=Marivivens niveibacter TaxID=1930667 RepID=A0A251X3B0_9RHOB|nr:pentapeptide repeat-containing protein [Marivivens niveibacter]OUD10653.1 hypothetical protein BVC71_03965 [Marivivens niveibacter]